MKIGLLVGGSLLLHAVGAMASLTVNDTWTVDAVVPEGSPVGIALAHTYTGLPSDPIASVAVHLNISGGYNGGFYGYLVLQDVGGHVATEVLLNRIGTSPSDPMGSGGAGMNVTLSDTGTASIHGATGIPTGTWLPDSSAAFSTTFGGMTANGTWTLFLANLTAGAGSGTLHSWGLEVSCASVPEPGCFGWVAGALGLVWLVPWCRRGRNSET